MAGAGIGGQDQPVGGLQLRAVDLTAQNRYLVPEHEQFDVLGAAVAGELGQHLHDLPQHLVCQRSPHVRIIMADPAKAGGQRRTSARRARFTSRTGRGGADLAAGTGLRGLADRPSLVGGVLTVDSPAGGGITVRGSLPGRASEVTSAAPTAW